jgi:thymidylate synthase
MKLKPTLIEARDIPDAWYLCLYEILRAEKKGTGGKYKINRGSYAGQYRLEFDSLLLKINFPEARPLHPEIPSSFGIPPPSDEEKINEYASYLMTSDKQPNEDYTYGERLVNPKLRFKDGRVIDPETGKIYDIAEEVLWDGGGGEFEIYPSSEEIPLGLNPTEEIIKMYKEIYRKEKDFGTNQATLEIGIPSDVRLDDPPCLRLIDTRIRKEESEWKLHFHVYFRSWDLWGGLPLNLAGLQLLKEYMAESISFDPEKDKSVKLKDKVIINPGETTAYTKGLHLYDDVWEIADQLTYGLHKHEGK